VQGETCGQRHKDVRKSCWIGWGNPIKLGKQFGNQSSHGVAVSTVQLGIGLGERLIAAGLQLEFRGK
jgi:hypothetical protein